MKNQFKILILIAFYLNCISTSYNSPGMQLDYNKKIYAKNQKDLIIRNISISNMNEENIEIKDFIEKTLKSNIKILLENNLISKNVNYHSRYNNHDKNSYYIDFYFSTYKNTIDIHPMYFPLSILSFTFYIWLGGDIAVFKQQIEMEIKIFDHKNNLIHSNNSKLNLEDNLNYYNIERKRNQILQIRSEYILSKIEKAIK